MVKVLSDDERHKMVIEAVTPGANVSGVARKYGLHRNTVIEHINRAVQDPEGKMRDAEAEAAFRRQVYELTR